MKHRIGYAILLDDESHNYAREMELDLSLKFNTRAGLRQSPHITIKTPFFVDDLQSQIEYFDSLAHSIKPFKIHLQGFDYFEPNVIFLNVQKNRTLNELHQKIIHELQSEYKIEPDPSTESDNVRFHSTLALNDLSEENFYEAKKYLSNKQPQFSFQAKTLGLFYYLSPEEGWIIYRRTKIGVADGVGG